MVKKDVSHKVAQGQHVCPVAGEMLLWNGGCYRIRRAIVAI